MSLFKSEFEIKIPFHDLDPMNIVWHGNYIKYMEQSRCDMFNKLNFTYYDMKNNNYAYPIVKMQTKFIKPLRFNQEVIVETSLEEIEPAIIIKYKMFDKKTGAEVFRAETMQIGVNIETGESMYSPPADLLKRIEKNNDK